MDIYSLKNLTIMVTASLSCGGLFAFAIRHASRWSQPTLGDVRTWKGKPTESVAQLQKIYDWRISQWSTAASTVFTSLLGFITTNIIEHYKNAPGLLAGWERFVTAGIAVGLAFYLFCMSQIRILRDEFRALFTRVVKTP